MSGGESPLVEEGARGLEQATAGDGNRPVQPSRTELIAHGRDLLPHGKQAAVEKVIESLMCRGFFHRSVT